MSNDNGISCDVPEAEGNLSEEARMHMDVIEEWRSLRAGGVLYEISNLGHVRRYIKPFTCAGSPYLQMYIPGRGNVCIHTLVTELFFGPKPQGIVVNHKDGNGFNPRLENLEYVTQSYNMLHASRTGLRKYGTGEKSTRWKLTDAQAQEVYDRYKAGGVTYIGLGQEYGVSSKCVDYIVKRRKGVNRGQ